VRRSQRRAHLLVWLLLAIVLPATIIAALVVQGQAGRAAPQAAAIEAR
jgi:hypothetical protein